MIKRWLRALILREPQFKVGQVVILTRPFSYLGYLPVTFDLIPVYWIVTGLLDKGRIQVEIAPLREAQPLPPKDHKFVKNTYFPDKLEVDPKDLQLADNIVQILYGKNNGH